jgi:hypothetical protein
MERQVTRPISGRGGVRLVAATSWKKALKRRQDESTHHIEFVPFSMEAGGVWGPAAQKFFNDCASKADNLDRDIGLYHWSSAKFCSAWRDTMSVLVARGRAQVGVLRRIGRSASETFSSNFFHFKDTCLGLVQAQTHSREYCTKSSAP